MEREIKFCKDCKFLKRRGVFYICEKRKISETCWEEVFPCDKACQYFQEKEEKQCLDNGV